MSDCTYNVYSLKPFGFFIAKFSGEVTMRDLGKAHDVMTEHPDYEPQVDELVDFSDASFKSLSNEEIKGIRDYMVKRPDRHDCRSVLVVGSRLEFGLSRMMGQTLDHDVPVDRHVAYDLRSALEWLRPGEVDDILAEVDRLQSAP